MLIVLIILILLLAGVFPANRYSKGWGYGPSGIVGLLLLVLVICFLVGAVPARWGW